MFEVGFTEIMLIFAIALLVLGPARLPKLAADLGRWAGRARGDGASAAHPARAGSPLRPAEGVAEALADDPHATTRLPRRRRPPRRNPPPRRTGPMSQSPREPEPLAEGTLISHLLELRDRLMRALIAIFIVFVPLVFFSNDLFTLVARPLIEKLPEGTSLIATSVVAPFMTPLKLALIAAIFVAMPVRALPGVGLRRAGPVPAREALCAAAVRLERRAVLRRRRVRLFHRVPADVRASSRRPRRKACG